MKSFVLIILTICLDITLCIESCSNTFNSVIQNFHIRNLQAEIKTCEFTELVNDFSPSDNDLVLYYIDISMNLKKINYNDCSVGQSVLTYFVPTSPYKISYNGNVFIAGTSNISVTNYNSIVVNNIREDMNKTNKILSFLTDSNLVFQAKLIDSYNNGVDSILIINTYLIFNSFNSDKIAIFDIRLNDPFAESLFNFGGGLKLLSGEINPINQIFLLVNDINNRNKIFVKKIDDFMMAKPPLVFDLITIDIANGSNFLENSALILLNGHIYAFLSISQIENYNTTNILFSNGCNTRSYKNFLLNIGFNGTLIKCIPITDIENGHISIYQGKISIVYNHPNGNIMQIIYNDSLNLEVTTLLITKASSQINVRKVVMKNEILYFLYNNGSKSLISSIKPQSPSILTDFYQNIIFLQITQDIGKTFKFLQLTSTKRVNTIDYSLTWPKHIYIMKIRRKVYTDFTFIDEFYNYQKNLKDIRNFNIVIPNTRAKNFSSAFSAMYGEFIVREINLIKTSTNSKENTHVKYSITYFNDISELNQIIHLVQINGECAFRCDFKSTVTSNYCFYIDSSRCNGEIKKIFPNYQ